jgi:peptidyl-tRNA hydrolase
MGEHLPCKQKRVGSTPITSTKQEFVMEDKPLAPFSPKMYIAVRKDLDMPIGKFGGQCAHAAVRAVVMNMRMVRVGRDKILDQWFDSESGFEAKIVLAVKDNDELVDVMNICHANKIPVAMVTDAGRTVFSEPTLTCAGIGPVTKEEEELFKHLKLYR